MSKIYNLVGRKVGNLTVESLNESDGTRDGTKWNLICKCGGSIVLEHVSITSKSKRTCGCGIRKFGIVGTQYGKLKVVDESLVKDHSGVRSVLCDCECGTKNYKVRLNNLTSGNTTSCGCQFGTHKMSDTRTYRIWESMKRRCRERLKESFPYHAGKGVTVCERWDSFENFFSDMGECPDGLSLDRIDVNGNYEPSNCRWATNSLQGYNKGIDPNNTSGKSGVSFYSRLGKWSSEIHVDGEHIRLGIFSNFEDAVKARKEAELKYYGFNKE